MATVALTDAEKISLRADSGIFRNYLVQKVVNEIGNQLGQSSFTQQTARWLVFGKLYIGNPPVVTSDSNITEFAVAKMIAGGLASKNDAAAGVLADQVISFLEANAPGNIPQGYLDEKTKMWA